jgi:hypothetical protein
VSGKGKGPNVPGRRGYGYVNDPGGVPSVRYGDTDAELLRECIDAVVSHGDAILLGATADQGAYVVRVLSDAGNGVFYPPSGDALQNVLTHVIDVARGL